MHSIMNLECDKYEAYCVKEVDVWVCLIGLFVGVLSLVVMERVM